MNENVKRTTENNIKDTRNDMSDSNVSPLIYNEKQSLILLRTKKLSAAIYLVTGLLSDTDAFGSQVKNAASDLLESIVLSFGMSDRIDRENIFNHGYRSLLVIDQALQALALGGMISGMNVHILIKEIEKIKSLWTDLKHTSAVSLVFGAPMPSHAFGEDFFLQDLSVYHKGHDYQIKDILKDKVVSYSKESKGQSYVKDKNIVSFLKKSKDSIDLNKEKDTRRNDILLIVKDKGNLSIKDIKTSITGCSEKTLQRTLNALVSEGALAKTGEKRWTLYRMGDNSEKPDNH